MKKHNKINRIKISTSMIKILLRHESGSKTDKNPEVHSVLDSVEQLELLQNKVPKPSPMLCLKEVENLHNYIGILVLSRPIIIYHEALKQDEGIIFAVQKHEIERYDLGKTRQSLAWMIHFIQCMLKEIGMLSFLEY